MNMLHPVLEVQRTTTAVMVLFTGLYSPDRTMRKIGQLGMSVSEIYLNP